MRGRRMSFKMSLIALIAAASLSVGSLLYVFAQPLLQLALQHG